MPNPTLTWLHLTDLHFGHHTNRTEFPQVKEVLIQSLRDVHKLSRPWDVILFTGDMTNRGGTAEFSDLDTHLRNILDHIVEWQGSRPYLLSVPGNHDLVRPNQSDAGVNELEGWNGLTEGFRRNFWENQPNSELYHSIIRNAFANYAEWSEKIHPGNCTNGLLPGDWSFKIEKDGASFGIVGLNSTFLQLFPDQQPGCLDIGITQFHRACGGEGNQFCASNHANILLTHQPEEWLSERASTAFSQFITSNSRFATHLCGHKHETEAQNTASAAGPPRHYWLGRSLFSRERYIDRHGAPRDRNHGYCVGRLEITGRDSGELTYWPIAFDILAGTWTANADRDVLTDYNTRATTPLTFRLTKHFDSPQSEADRKDHLPAGVPTVNQPQIPSPQNLPDIRPNITTTQSTLKPPSKAPNNASFLATARKFYNPLRIGIAAIVMMALTIHIAKFAIPLVTPTPQPNDNPQDQIPAAENEPEIIEFDLADFITKQHFFSTDGKKYKTWMSSIEAKRPFKARIHARFVADIDTGSATSWKIRNRGGIEELLNYAETLRSDSLKANGKSEPDAEKAKWTAAATATFERSFALCHFDREDAPAIPTGSEITITGWVTDEFPIGENIAFFRCKVDQK